MNIKHQIAPFLSQEGFSQQGRLFYRIANDFALCISFESVSLLYCHYFLLPLYMPCDGIHFTYGDRLEHYTGGKLHPLQRSVSKEEEFFWLDKLKGILQDDILPFFAEISSPKMLMNCSEKMLKQFFFCPPERLALLRAYTAFYLRNFNQMERSIAAAQSFIETSCLSAALKESLLNRMEELQYLSKCPKQVQDLWLKDTIDSTKRLCRFK